MFHRELLVEEFHFLLVAIHKQKFQRQENLLLDLDAFGDVPPFSLIIYRYWVLTKRLCPLRIRVMYN